MSATIRNRWNSKRTSKDNNERRLLNNLANAAQNVSTFGIWVEQGTATVAELDAAKRLLAQAQAAYDELFAED